MMMFLDGMSYLLCAIAIAMAWSTKHAVMMPLYTDEQINKLRYSSWRTWLVSLLLHFWVNVL